MPSSAGTGTQHSTVTGVPHLPDPGKGWEELIPSLLLNGTTRRLSSLPPSRTDKHNPPGSEDPRRLSPSPAVCGPGAEDRQPKLCQAVSPALPCCSCTFPVRLRGVHQQNVSRSTTDIWPIIPLQREHNHVRNSPSSLRPGLTLLGFQLSNNWQCTQCSWHCSQHKLGHELQCWDNPAI